MSKLKNKIGLLFWSAHYEGWTFAVLRIFLKIASVLGSQGTKSDWFARIAERRFDKRFNVHTSGVVSPAQAGVPEDRREHAIEYCPTSAHRFGWLLSELGVDFSDYVFVDFGSGKGRAVLMATDFPFRNIVGVEISSQLHEISNQNLLTFRNRHQKCHDVQLLCQDATLFEFPEHPLVLYFFNPFSSEILAKVIENLWESLARQPRKVIVVYYNPLHADVFRRSADFVEAASHRQAGEDWAVYEACETHTPEQRELLAIGSMT